MGSFFILRSHMAWLGPLLLFVLIAPFTPTLDVAIERYFYEGGHFYTNFFFQSLYDFSFLPVLIFVVASMLLLSLSFFFSKMAYLKKPLLLILLTLAIGAGLITHLLLKDHWGRPRPKQVIEFGGTQHYRPFWSPNFFSQPQPSKSFPCGHCTLGFFFFAPALAARRLGKEGWSFFFFGIAFAFGISLSLARMAQGGHFLSDILATALVMWLTAWWLDQLLFGKQRA